MRAESGARKRFNNKMKSHMTLQTKALGNVIIVTIEIDYTPQKSYLNLSPKTMYFLFFFFFQSPCLSLSLKTLNRERERGGRNLMKRSTKEVVMIVVLSIKFYDHRCRLLPKTFECAFSCYLVLLCDFGNRKKRHTVIKKATVDREKPLDSDTQQTKCLSSCVLNRI